MRELVSHGRWEEIQLSQLDLVGGGGAHMRLEAGAHPSPSGNGEKEKGTFLGIWVHSPPQLEFTDNRKGVRRAEPSLLPGGLEAVRGQAEGLEVGAAWEEMGSDGKSE